MDGQAHGKQYTGEVKFWSAQKGYGFIIAEDGQEVFCHYKNIIAKDGGDQGLIAETKVNYYLTPNHDGREMACNVTNEDGSGIEFTRPQQQPGGFQRGGFPGGGFDGGKGFGKGKGKGKGFDGGFNGGSPQNYGNYGGGGYDQYGGMGGGFNPQMAYQQQYMQQMGMGGYGGGQ